MAGFEQLDELALHAWIRGDFPVIKIIHMTFQERVFLEKLDNSKRGAADGENIHAAVLITLCNVQNFGGAADTRDSLVEGKEHAELGLFFQAAFHHGAVTRFEYVQGKLRAGKEDDVQRKQRNAFRPHGSHTKSYQRAGPGTGSVCGQGFGWASGFTSE